MRRLPSVAVRHLGLALALCLPPVALAAPEAGGDRAPALTRIAFGSCAEQHKPQPIWAAVQAADPELFLFLGDNVYGDTRDRGELEQAYAALAAQPGFQRLR
jgi:alkaline phosphatase D